MKKEDILSIREFNRNYVLILGILNKNMNNLDYSLTEGRILFEIHAGNQVIANQLAVKLQLDRSYLNRIINRLVEKKLIKKVSSKSDSRIKVLKLTTVGETALKEINQKNNHLTQTLFSNFNQKELNQITDTMALITDRLL